MLLHFIIIKKDSVFPNFSGSTESHLAERTGFEPAEAVHLARFPSVCHRPLDHLSKYKVVVRLASQLFYISKKNAISQSFLQFICKMLLSGAHRPACFCRTRCADCRIPTRLHRLFAMSKYICRIFEAHG